MQVSTMSVAGSPIQMALSAPVPTVLSVPITVPPPQLPPPPSQRFSTYNLQRFPNQNQTLNQSPGGAPFQKPNNFYGPPFKQSTPIGQGLEFDGKRLRKAVVRKTIDYNAAIVKQLEARVWQRDSRDQRAVQPDSSYYIEMVPPLHLVHNPINSVTTKFVRTSTNKMRCPIFCVVWTPEGRRLVTGASSGEFTLWNGLTFNFETILQAHDSPVRCMVWSHNDLWMVTGDHSGFIKYWQSNMNNVKMYQAHKEPLRGISFCPTDQKFATCSDDGTVRIWDFLRCHEEKILRGHGADVKCVAWHPQKSLVVSGSRDSQQPIKLWDPKAGQSLATLHVHKSTVLEVRWNSNGNWLLTGSRDHLVKLFDIRKLNQEVQTFRGHKKEVSSLSWHPIHETLFASGGSDGAVMFWKVGADKEVGVMEQAHDGIVWSLGWHPLGHILCSGSNDHTCKFWTRNRPGDKMRDKYNLNLLPALPGNEEAPEYDEPAMAPSIPGMGLEQGLLLHLRSMDQEMENEGPAIPGLDFGTEEMLHMQLDHRPSYHKKVPYAKPIPRQFQQQWMENKRPLLVAPPSKETGGANARAPGDGDAPPPSGLFPVSSIPLPPTPPGGKPGSGTADLNNRDRDRGDRNRDRDRDREHDHDRDVDRRQYPPNVQSDQQQGNRRRSRFEPLDSQHNNNNVPGGHQEAYDNRSGPMGHNQQPGHWQSMGDSDLRLQRPPPGRDFLGDGFSERDRDSRDNRGNQFNDGGGEGDADQREDRGKRGMWGDADQRMGDIQQRDEEDVDERQRYPRQNKRRWDGYQKENDMQPGPHGPMPHHQMPPPMDQRQMMPRQMPGGGGGGGGGPNMGPRDFGGPPGNPNMVPVGGFGPGPGPGVHGHGPGGNLPGPGGPGGHGPPMNHMKFGGPPPQGRGGMPPPPAPRGGFRGRGGNYRGGPPPPMWNRGGGMMRNYQ